MPLPDLPQEILDLICECIKDRKTLQALRLASRMLLSSASRQLFKVLDIRMSLADLYRLELISQTGHSSAIRQLRLSPGGAIVEDSNQENPKMVNNDPPATLKAPLSATLKRLSRLSHLTVKCVGYGVAQSHSCIEAFCNALEDVKMPHLDSLNFELNHIVDFCILQRILRLETSHELYYSLFKQVHTLRLSYTIDGYHGRHEEYDHIKFGDDDMVLLGFVSQFKNLVRLELVDFREMKRDYVHINGLRFLTLSGFGGQTPTVTKLIGDNMETLEELTINMSVTEGSFEALFTSLLACPRLISLFANRLRYSGRGRCCFRGWNPKHHGLCSTDTADHHALRDAYAWTKRNSEAIGLCWEGDADGHWYLDNYCSLEDYRRHDGNIQQLS